MKQQFKCIRKIKIVWGMSDSLFLNLNQTIVTKSMFTEPSVLLTVSVYRVNSKLGDQITSVLINSVSASLISLTLNKT